MVERNFVIPITEPGVPIPILEPSFVPIEPAEFILSKGQRLAILQRDENRCQATVKHQHDRRHALEVDHIIPQRYAMSVGLPDPDIPENLLTKCRNAHDLKHRDRITARDKYHQSDGDTFQEMFEERVVRLENGQIYWNDENDRTDFVQAFKRTQLARKKGWQYPLTQKQKESGYL